jgi:hypothetical protein
MCLRLSSKVTFVYVGQGPELAATLAPRHRLAKVAPMFEPHIYIVYWKSYAVFNDYRQLRIPLPCASCIHSPPLPHISPNVHLQDSHTPQNASRVRARCLPLSYTRGQP